MSIALQAAGPSNSAAERRQLADKLAQPAIRSVRISGLVSLGLFIILLILAAFVPIASGAVATGRIAVEGERKVVQHPTGGIVSEILVKEGDVVEEGAVIVRLDPIQASAAAGVVNSQIDALRAEEAVRMAEATGDGAVVFPKDLTGRRKNPKVDAILTAEEAAFKARRDIAASGIMQFDQQLIQLEQSLASAKAGREAQESQAGLYDEELRSLRPLFEKGLALKSRVLALERSLEAARGEAASLSSEEKRLAAKAGETRILRSRVDIDRRAEAADTLRKLRSELSIALERQLATDDTLQRTDLRAPTSGVVMAVRVTTIGGVVEPGQPLLEIVPQAKQLMVRARISPTDVDDIRQGMPATVRLLAGSRRSPSIIEGKVLSVSADALTDQRTEEPYFEARIAIAPEEAVKVPVEVIGPGLPAEVLIRTGEHTILNYLLAPIENAAFRTMRDT